MRTQLMSRITKALDQIPDEFMGVLVNLIEGMPEYISKPAMDQEQSTIEMVKLIKRTLAENGDSTTINHQEFPIHVLPVGFWVAALKQRAITLYWLNIDLIRPRISMLLFEDATGRRYSIQVQNEKVDIVPPNGANYSDVKDYSSYGILCVQDIIAKLKEGLQDA